MEFAHIARNSTSNGQHPHRGAMSTRVPILAYHAIVGGDLHYVLPQDASLQHAVSAANFRQQLDSLIRYGCRSLLPKQLVGRLPDKALIITFDDGYEDHRFAADELMRRRLQGAFYITWSKLGEAGYLSRAAVRELYNCGFEIGSHSLTHTPLTHLAPTALHRELIESKGRLEDLIGGPIYDFAFPFGAYDRHVLASAFEAGYARVMTSNPGLARTGAQVLPRLGIGASTTIKTFEKIITGGRMSILKFRLGGCVCRRIRRLIGATAKTSPAERNCSLWGAQR